MDNCWHENENRIAITERGDHLCAVGLTCLVVFVVVDVFSVVAVVVVKPNAIICE